jgi:hypothetical protein
LKPASVASFAAIMGGHGDGRFSSSALARMIRDGAVRDWRLSSSSTDSRVEQSEGSTDLALPRQLYGRHSSRSAQTREEHVEPRKVLAGISTIRAVPSIEFAYSHGSIQRIGVFARSGPLELRFSYLYKWKDTAMD